jgi:hypothetical protein
MTFSSRKLPAIKGFFNRAGAFVVIAFCSLPLNAGQGNRIPGALIIKYSENATAADIQRGVENARLRLHRYWQTAPMASAGEIGLVSATTGIHTDRALEVLRNDPAVEHVEQSIAFSNRATSDDPFYLDGSLWGMYGNLSTPASAFGSQAAEAWSAGYVGSHSVYVAVIDDGIKIDHPELAANIWANPFEIPDNNIDDDGNGYIDDQNGWNFVSDSKTIFELGDDHSTLVAGIIGAVGGNAAGVAGVNWNVSMIPARALGGGSGTTENIVEAIDYCIDLKTRHGLNLVAINASWGDTEYSQFLHDAVIRAAKADILFIAAAGNSSRDNDAEHFSPANLDSTEGTPGETAASYNNVISVTAIGTSGLLPDFASFGATKVHLGAPGVGILTTYFDYPASPYASANGTSLSAPFVTGAVALYASTHPDASAEDMRLAILNSVTPTAALVGKTSTGGRLNLSTIILPTPPMVVGRHLFYNGSAWDGNNLAANASDDAAIATDKSALTPGGTAVFANYSSYTRGINGIMIDLANPTAQAAAISASDFAFKIGNNNIPSGWANAPAPSSVTVRSGAGLNGSDRITIIWSNNQIQKTWLQVTMLETPNTGLLAPDVFYFGNAVAESGNSTSNAFVDGTDELGARNNRRNFLNLAPVDFLYDYDRNRFVDGSDELFARNNRANFLNAIKLISPP